MKITNNSPAPKPASGSSTSGTARTGGASRQAASGSTGTLTGPAARLNQLESQLSPSDFSAAKVSEISSAIASGHYQVNAGAVADKLLASTAALAGKSSGGA